MGVGTYHNNFGGSGSTFMVSGPLPVEEDYDRAVKEYGELFSFEDWATDQYQDFFDALKRDIQDAAAELGFQEPVSTGRGAETAAFDRSFFDAAGDSLVGVGIRWHETDLIVGTAGGYQFAKWMADPAGYMSEIIERTGRSVDAYHADFVALASEVEEYVRLSLQENKYDCRYRTSAWTSAGYDLPEDIEPQKAALKASIVTMREKLMLDSEDVIAAAEGEERLKLLQDIVECGNSFDLMVPLFTAEGGCVTLYNATRDRFDDSAAVQSELPQALFDLPSEGGFAIVPRTEEFAAVFQLLQRKAHSRGGIAISGDEYMAILDDDLEVQIDGDNGYECLTWSLASTPAPQMGL